MLAASDHPFSDLRVDPQDWLGPTVVSGESQVLQGRLGISPSAWSHQGGLGDPLSRVRLDRDAFWQRALSAYRDGFQSYSTDSELDQIVGRNSGYDMPDPWEEPVGIFLKQRERTPYVTFQDIYGVLDIPASRQSSDNAKRIQQIATDCGWVQTRRRVVTSSERVRAFFPDHVDKSTSG